jgi:uncharacterized protein
MGGNKLFEKKPSPETLFKQIAEEAKRFFSGARGSHDWDHTQRVLSLCLMIGKKEGGNLTILRLAALLHDIGRAAEDHSNGKICHSQAGASMASQILKAHGIKKETMNRVIHCIQTHRFRKRRVPVSKEAKILFDADKLDSIGAVGIGRAFLFAGEVGARLHNQETDIQKTKPYTIEDTAFREYTVKLRKIKDRIFTEEGKRIARVRHRFMVIFFERLNKEIDGRL